MFKASAGSTTESLREGTDRGDVQDSEACGIDAVGEVALEDRRTAGFGVHGPPEAGSGLSKAEVRWDSVLGEVSADSNSESANGGAVEAAFRV